jgi:3-methyladenine DNA glycosylase/8-oxoguanine DNA glycosylase
LELELFVQPPFGFRETVFSHGWVTLAPFQWDAEGEALLRVERLDSDKVVRLRIWDGGLAGGNCVVRVSIEGEELNEEDRREVEEKVRWMLRLDEDLSEFYDLCREHDALAFVVETGAGRLLRSPTVFEDAVKVLCTTNTNWSQTMAVIMRLCENVGKPFDLEEGLFCFPTAEEVAARDEAFLREQIRLGYRATYVLELAETVASGRLDLESLKGPTMQSEAVRHLLLKLNGFGPYAVSQMLVLLGHYDYLGVDTDLRNFVSRNYFGGARVTDTEVLHVYQRWGKWKYLVYWAEAFGRTFAGAESV